MRIVSLAVGLSVLVACTPGGKGPGVTGSYFLLFEPVQGRDIVAGDLPSTGELLFSAGDGMWVVDFGESGIHLYDEAQAATVYELTQRPAAPFRDGFVYVGGGATVQYTEDGSTWIDIPGPEDIEVDEITADWTRDVLYASGTKPLVAGQQDRVGFVFASSDLGQTWDVVAGGLYAANAGSAYSAGIAQSTGYVHVGVCPQPPFQITDCADYFITDSGVHQGALPEIPHAIGVDADGRIVGSGRPERGGRIGPDLVLYEPDDADEGSTDMDFFHVGFIGGYAGSIDRDGVFWGTGWGFDDHTWWRSTTPAGRSFDQRAAVLRGPGCERYFRYAWDGGTLGDDIEVPITNTADEPIFVIDVRTYALEIPWGEGTDAIRVEPGETRTFTRREELTLMAITRDGRCMGFGEARKLAGSRLP
ncbi:MAG: hypothetical protein H6734_21240 [Alphaproteobacteria bacterium]|nr:hypothetical protein [Alphaproteobacteria bacterium]